MSDLPKEIHTWLHTLDLKYPIRNPKHDLSNGYCVAEILNRYFPDDFSMHTFDRGMSAATRTNNWVTIMKRMSKKNLSFITPTECDLVVHKVPGASTQMIVKLYNLLTNRAVKVEDYEPSTPSTGPNYMRSTVCLLLKDPELDRIENTEKKKLMAQNIMSNYAKMMLDEKLRKGYRGNPHLLDCDVNAIQRRLERKQKKLDEAKENKKQSIEKHQITVKSFTLEDIENVRTDQVPLTIQTPNNKLNHSPQKTIPAEEIFNKKLSSKMIFFDSPQDLKSNALDFYNLMRLIVPESAIVNPTELTPTIKKGSKETHLDTIFKHYFHPVLSSTTFQSFLPSFEEQYAPLIAGEQHYQLVVKLLSTHTTPLVIKQAFLSLMASHVVIEVNHHLPTLLQQNLVVPFLLNSLHLLSSTHFSLLKDASLDIVARKSIWENIASSVAKCLQQLDTAVGQEVFSSFFQTVFSDNSPWEGIYDTESLALQSIFLSIGFHWFFSKWQLFLDNAHAFYKQLRRLLKDRKIPEIVFVPLVNEFCRVIGRIGTQANEITEDDDETLKDCEEKREALFDLSEEILDDICLLLDSRNSKVHLYCLRTIASLCDLFPISKIHQLLSKTDLIKPIIDSIADENAPIEEEKIAVSNELLKTVASLLSSSSLFHSSFVKEIGNEEHEIIEYSIEEKTAVLIKMGEYLLSNLLYSASLSVEHEKVLPPSILLSVIDSIHAYSPLASFHEEYKEHLLMLLLSLPLYVQREVLLLPYASSSGRNEVPQFLSEVANFAVLCQSLQDTAGDFNEFFYNTLTDTLILDLLFEFVESRLEVDPKEKKIEQLKREKSDLNVGKLLLSKDFCHGFLSMYSGLMQDYSTHPVSKEEETQVEHLVHSHYDILGCAIICIGQNDLLSDSDFWFSVMKEWMEPFKHEFATQANHAFSALVIKSFLLNAKDDTFNEAIGVITNDFYSSLEAFLLQSVNGTSMKKNREKSPELKKSPTMGDKENEKSTVTIVEEYIKERVMSTTLQHLSSLHEQAHQWIVNILLRLQKDYPTEFEISDFNKSLSLLQPH